MQTHDRSEAWTPAVLTDYEIGRVMAAIEAVSRSAKVIAEVGGRKADCLRELESDLQHCLELAEVSGIHLWTKQSGSRVRFGVYSERWALDALDFLDRTDLSGADRAWINGLLFGYRADAIQKFIDSAYAKNHEDVAPPVSNTAR